MRPIVVSKKQERLAAFFHFCKQRGWVKSNPVMSVKLPQVDDKPTLPFSHPELGESTPCAVWNSAHQPVTSNVSSTRG